MRQPRHRDGLGMVLLLILMYAVLVGIAAVTLHEEGTTVRPIPHEGP